MSDGVPRIRAKTVQYSTAEVVDLGLRERCVPQRDRDQLRVQVLERAIVDDARAEAREQLNS